MTTTIQDATWQESLAPLDTNEDANNSDTVRSQIDATRSRLSSHLDKIQERLQPETIKQQAQDAIQNALTDSMESAKEQVNGYVQQIDWNDVRDGVLDSVRRNPVPAALIGIGLGWMFLNGGRNGENSTNRRRRNAAQPPYQHGLGWREETPQMGVPGKKGDKRQNGENHYSAQSESSGESLGAQVKEKTSEIVGQVKDTIYQQTANLAAPVQNKAEEIGEGMSEWLEQWQQSGESNSEWRREKLDELSDYTQRSLEENPLFFGAVSLAVGAGLGMLLPTTHYENQVMGDLRQQTLEKAQSWAEDVKERTQTVLNEIQPDVQKTAGDVVKKVEDVGKQAVDELRQSLQNASAKLDTTSMEPKTANQPNRAGERV